MNQLALEINGSRGSLAFDVERLNELQVSLGAGGASGFQRLLVTEPQHPFMSFWSPPGHITGWDHSFVHELHHLLLAIAGEGSVRPHGADFEEGYRAAEVCDAIARSADSGVRERLAFSS